MWKPTSLLISALLVLDAFFLAYAVGLNSRHVLVYDDKNAPSAVLPTNPLKAGGTAPAVQQSAPVDRKSPPKVDGGARPGSVTFVDVNQAEERLRSSLLKAAAGGMIDPSPDGKFHPGEAVTRADLLRWLSRIHPSSPAVPAQSNQDNAGDPYVTRQEFAHMYVLFSGKADRAQNLDHADIESYLRYDISKSGPGDRTYMDAGDVDDWARKWVAVAQQAGVIRQCFDVDPYSDEQERRYLRPHQKVTRGEAINILVKLYGT